MERHGRTDNRTLVAGTRGSALAMQQTELVVERLRAAHPEVEFKTLTIRTEGDHDHSTPLSVLGGKGVFVKDLERALLDNRIDFAVHSLKDVPATLPPGLVLAAIPPRADARDALVSRRGAAFADLPAGARVGTGSARRRAELLHLRSDIAPVDVRGNVDTRIRRVREGDLDAVVLAAAGLHRLDRLDEAAQIFSVDELLPAVGQGALAVETRADDQFTRGLVAAIDDAATRCCVLAERGFLQRLGGGCTTPAAAHCTIEGDRLSLRALITGADESLVQETVQGPTGNPEALGAYLADLLMASGAQQKAGNA